MNTNLTHKTVITLLEKRASGATVCPSEVARVLASNDQSSDWRRYMPAVHHTVDQMVTDGIVQLSWKGKPLALRTGPYRIRRRRE